MKWLYGKWCYSDCCKCAPLEHPRDCKEPCCKPHFPMKGHAHSSDPEHEKRLKKIEAFKLDPDYAVYLKLAEKFKL